MGLFSSKCVSKTRLDGKTTIITGANTGIGKETAKDFFLRGARVIVACRNLDKANAAVADIKRQCSENENVGQILATKLDLTSLNSVRACAKNILDSEQRIDLLVNNAGVMMCPESRTEDGFEMQLGTNHLGHFLLTLLLLPKICQSGSARIVNVSSLAHKLGHVDFDDLNWKRRQYSALGAYQQSKLANILFTRELAKKLNEANVQGVNVYSLHPGVITTELGRHLDSVYFTGIVWFWRNIVSFFIKNPQQGAQTSIYCSVDENCANETGLYYAECAVAAPSTRAKNAKDAERLWIESLKLVGLPADYNPFKEISQRDDK